MNLVSYNRSVFTMCLFLFFWTIPVWSKPKWDEFQPQNEPSQADWQFFMQNSPAWREKLWAFYYPKIQFEDWSWGWRLGWVNSCENSSSSFCTEMLSRALLDRAILIRAKAVEVLGHNLRGTHNQNAINRLAQLYATEAQHQKGKVLLIQKRILSAIHGIGGKQATNTAAKLVAGNAQAKEYLEKLR